MEGKEGIADEAGSRRQRKYKEGKVAWGGKKNRGG
jgi:hypothetical protein